MAQGTNYEDKQQLLLEGIQELVYKNGQGAIDGEANQKALKNLVETFWAPEDGKQYARKDGKWDEVQSSNSGVCTVEDFSDQVGTSRIELKRTICGDDVAIVGQITQSFYDGNSSFPSIKVIPRGVNFRKWFRVSEIVTINETQISWNTNSNGAQVAGLGYLFIDELSSTIDGPSNLSLDATDVGVQRYYNTFNFGQIEDGEGFMAYDVNSPCDLISNDGFTIGYKNQEQLSRGNSADNIRVSFSIKGTLYGSDV